MVILVNKTRFFRAKILKKILRGQIACGMKYFLRKKKCELQRNGTLKRKYAEGRKCRPGGRPHRRYMKYAESVKGDYRRIKNEYLENKAI